MDKVTIEVSGPVATLTLANPPFNTLDVPIMKSMVRGLKELAQRPAGKRPRCLLIKSGIPGIFSHGIDPEAVLAADQSGREEIFLALGELTETLWLGALPVIADVNGPALAGGAVLATIADFAVFDARAAKLCYSEVKVGLPVPFFVQQLVRSKIHPGSWNEIFLMGRNVDAKEALRIGFANALYQSDEERDEVLASFVGRIVRLSPEVVSQTKLWARQDEKRHLENFRLNLKDFARFLTEDYLGKGMRAVLKGEAPKF